MPKISTKNLDRLVEYYAPETENESDDVVVSHNGVNYIIKRGETVMIPYKVRLILDRAAKQKMTASRLITKLVSETR